MQRRVHILLKVDYTYNVPAKKGAVAEATAPLVCILGIYLWGLYQSLIRPRPGYTTPWSIMASTTLTKPAILAPAS